MQNVGFLMTRLNLLVLTHGSSLIFSVGKIRKKWLRSTIGEVGLGSMRAVKEYIDPQNIFGSNNLMVGEPEQDHHDNPGLTTVLQSKL